jgi:hypothetical protein
MGMTTANSGKPAAAESTIVSASLRRVYAYNNKNGNPTVSAIVDVATAEGVASHTIHLSLNGGAKAITVETLRHYGITAEMFDSELDIPVKIRLFADGAEPELIGAPRGSDKSVLQSIGL